MLSALSSVWMIVVYKHVFLQLTCEKAPIILNLIFLSKYIYENYIGIYISQYMFKQIWSLSQDIGRAVTENGAV